MPRCVADPTWLAELVEITLPNRTQLLYSACLETMKPSLGAEPLPADGALDIGYPDLLNRYGKGAS